MRDKHAIVGHLEDELADEPNDVVDPFGSLGLGEDGSTLGIIIDGVAEVLHIIDEFVPPVGIFTNSLHLLRSREAILDSPKAFEVAVLFLGNLQLEGCHLLVLGHGHSLGGILQSLAGDQKLVTDPRAGGDTHAQSDDTEELHDIHATLAEHHHPTLVAAHAESETETDDTGEADGITHESCLGEGLHGGKQLVQALVDGGKAHRQKHVRYRK